MLRLCDPILPPHGDTPKPYKYAVDHRLTDHRQTNRRHRAHFKVLSWYPLSMCGLDTVADTMGILFETLWSPDHPKLAAHHSQALTLFVRVEVI